MTALYTDVNVADIVSLLTYTGYAIIFWPYYIVSQTHRSYSPFALQSDEQTSKSGCNQFIISNFYYFIIISNIFYFCFLFVQIQTGMNMKTLSLSGAKFGRLTKTYLVEECTTV